MVFLHHALECVRGMNVVTMDVDDATDVMCIGGVCFEQALADALSGVDQGEGASLRGLTETLTARSVMTHDSKKVRTLAALCLSDLMRVYAPEAPIEGDAAMRDVYELFLDALSNLKSLESEEFESAKSLLLNVANIGLCVPMLDLDCDGAETLVQDLFKVLLDAVNATNATTVSEEIVKVLSTMIEESSDEDTPVPSDILFELLSRLIDPIRTENPAAFKVATELVQKCEHQLHAPIQTFLTQAMHGTVDEEDALAPLSKRHVDIIEEIAVCDPTALVTVWPAVIDDLQADDLSMRLRAAKLFGRVFSFKDSVVAEEYPHLLLEFVRRFNDKSPEIRMEMIKWSSKFLRTRIDPSAGLTSVPAATVVKQVRERLHDFDDQIRCAAINALCDNLDKPTSAELFPHDLMQDIGERIKDKKVSVRKTALKRLCISYRAYAQRCAEDAPTWEAKRFDWIPCAFLRAITIPDVRLHTIEPVLAEIFPAKMSAELRSTFWLRALNLADPFTVRCLQHLLVSKSRIQADMREYMLLRVRLSKMNKAEGTAALAKVVDSIKVHFPDQQKAKNAMMALHSQKDGNIFRCIQTILNPETTFNAAVKAEEDALKRSKSSSQAVDHDFIKSLMLKIQSAPFGREHVRGTLKAACKATREASRSSARPQAVVVALEHLVILAESFPKLFSGCGEEINELLDASDESTVTSTCKVASEAALALKLTPRRSTIWKKLKDKCASGSRKQSKLALKALGMLQLEEDEQIDASDMMSGAHAGKLVDVYDELVESLAEETCIDSDLPAVLGAIATVGSLHQKVFMSRISDVEQYVTHTLLTRPLPTRRVAVGVVSDVAELQAYGLKALAKAAAHRAAAKTPEYAFSLRVLELLHTYAEPSAYQEDGLFAGYSAADGAHLQFTACKAILAISRGVAVGLVKPAAWVCVSLFLHQCESSTMRLEFVQKLKRGLCVRPSERAMPMMWAATLAMALVDKEKRVRDAATETFASWVSSQRQRSSAYAAQEATKGSGSDASKFLLVHMPEYVLVYLVFLLVRHPLAPKTAEDGMLDRGQQWRQVQLILSAVVGALTQGANGDAVPMTCKMLRRLKTTLDKVDPNKSDLIYSLSDLTLFLVVDQAGSKGWDTSKFPGHVVYPTQLYQTTQFMASGPPVKEGAQPGLGDYSHLPRGYVIVRSVPIASTTTTTRMNAKATAKPAQKRTRAKPTSTNGAGASKKSLKQTKLNFTAGTRAMPGRAARRDAIVDVDARDIENEFDDYESEEDYDQVDEGNNNALVVVSSPPTSPEPLKENTPTDDRALKRKSQHKSAPPPASSAGVEVDPEENRSRRRRR